MCDYNVFVTLEHELNTKQDMDLLLWHDVKAEFINKVGDEITYNIKGFYTDIVRFLAELSNMDLNAEEITDIMVDGFYS